MVAVLDERCQRLFKMTAQVAGQTLRHEPVYAIGVA